MRRPALCSVLVLLLLIPAAVGQPPPPDAGGPVDPAGESAVSASAVSTTADSARAVDSRRSLTQVETRRTLFRVSMTRDGDAQWTVRTLYDLDSGAEREAFEEFVAAYRAGDTTVGPNAAAWRRAAASTADATGRSMTIQNVSRDGGLRNQTTGALVLRFRWTNFAQETGDSTFRVRDVFQEGANTWLPRVDADQLLIVETVADARITSTNYPLTDFEIRVAGPRDLTAEPVDVTYTLAPTTTESPTPTTSSPTVTTTTTRSQTTTLSPTPTPSGETDDVVAFGAVVIALAAAVVALVAYQGGLGGVAGVDTTDDGDGGPALDSPDTDADGESTDGAVSESASDDGAAESTADTDDPSVTAGEQETDTDLDPELLSDEERVEHLLEQNGGRMRQADIVSETGWSDAKVSQLLSAMADEDRIDKLRLGRENLISFPDVDGTDDDGE